MANSNLAVLTKSHTIVAAKKRAKREQLTEVVFDDAARRDFLTGFHKRKVQKKEAAKQKAKEREKQERLEARREHRHMLADQARKNAEEAERAYGGIPAYLDQESEWEGTGHNSSFADKGKGASEEQEEYEDEEQLATVTVVEEFDPHALLYGKASGPESTDDKLSSQQDKLPSHSHPHQLVRARSKDMSKAKAKTNLSTKVNNVKYQTSAARKAERAKQQRRKTEKAERAGGKASRRGGSKGRR